MDSPASDEPAPPPLSSPPQTEPTSLAGALDVGPTLRAARERAGRSLAECSRQLFIRQAFLEALEQGRHRDLPGGAYAAGFLRTYAEFLDLDGEELVRRFRQEGAGGFANRTELMFPSPVSEGRIPGGAVIFLGMVMATLVYGGWYLLSGRPPDDLDRVPPLPDRLATMLNRQPAAGVDAPRPAVPEADNARAREDVVPPADDDDDDGVKPPDGKSDQPAVAPAPPAALPPAPVEPVPAKPDSLRTEPPRVEPAKPDSLRAAVAKPEAAPPEGATAPAAASSSIPVPADVPAGKVYGGEHADARVSLRAVADDCWVQVREMDGAILASRLLRRGDTLRLPNRAGLSLMVGNAGALEVTVDGRRLPPLGAIGQVRRDLRVDPEQLLRSGG